MNDDDFDAAVGQYRRWVESVGRDNPYRVADGGYVDLKLLGEDKRRIADAYLNTPEGRKVTTKPEFVDDAAERARAALMAAEKAYAPLSGVIGSLFRRRAQAAACRAVAEALVEVNALVGVADAGADPTAVREELMRLCAEFDEFERELSGREQFS